MKSATKYTNIFDKHVTVFPSLAPPKDTTPSVRTLGEFLNGGTHYVEQISRARQLRSSAAAMYDAGDVEGCNKALKQYDEIKMQLPCMIPQGVCPTAHNDGFTSYTDVLCLDIDIEKPGKQPNGNELFDLNELKHFFASLDCVAYCGLSLGGLGLFVLIPIADHERHADYWRAWEMICKKVGITVDPATKNIARKRIMSLDTSAYYNEAAKVFDKLPGGEVQHPQQRQQAQRPRYDAPQCDVVLEGATDEERMKAAAHDAIARHIDMTADYNDWVRLGASIANTLGESGRSLFHDLSSLNAGYDYHEADGKFTSLLQGDAPRSCGFGTFFRMCKDNNVTVPRATRNNNTKHTKPQKSRTRPQRPRFTPRRVTPQQTDDEAAEG